MMLTIIFYCQFSSFKKNQTNKTKTNIKLRNDAKEVIQSYTLSKFYVIFARLKENFLLKGEHNTQVNTVIYLLKVSIMHR
jgi:hypothetical protein